MSWLPFSMGSYWNSSENNESSNKYGWKKDKADVRDKLYHLSRRIQQDDLPEEVDLRNQCPVVYDQGKLGSCTANAIGAAYEFDELKQHNHDEFSPSRLFIYYNERNMEGRVDEDAGAEIRDGMKAINSVGVCHRNLWPYDISKFTDKPTDDCFEDAKNHKSIKYERLTQNLHELRHCISEGYPFVFGFSVYESFESEEVAKTGYMPIPKPDEKLLGGHAVMAVGYDKNNFIIRNSWGETWGDHGYFYMPIKFLLNPQMCSDFWTLRQVTQD